MSVVGLFLIVILTARAIYVSLYEGHELCARCDLYEDADGSSTREAIERFGFKRIRFVILLSSALGFCMATTHSLLIASSSGTVESGKLLAVLSWVCCHLF
jgi:hypothetical protein